MRAGDKRGEGASLMGRGISNRRTPCNDEEYTQKRAYGRLESSAAGTHRGASESFRGVRRHADLMGMGSVAGFVGVRRHAAPRLHGMCCRRLGRDA